MAKTLYICMSNDQIGLGAEAVVQVSSTNLPMAHMRFRTVVPIYWEVEQLAYDANLGVLKVRVKNYRPGDVTQRFLQQHPKAPVKGLLFEKFDWKEMQRHLVSFQKIMLEEYLYNLEARPFANTEHLMHLIGQVKPKVAASSSDKPRPQEAYQSHQLQAKIGWKNVTLMQGYALCRVAVKWHHQEVELRVPNSFLLPEFEVIKPWFAKKAGVARFEITAQVKCYTDGRLEAERVACAVLEGIGPEFIEGIRYQRIYGIARKPGKFQPDKALFSTDDIFDALSEVLEGGNLFGDTEEAMLQMFLEKADVRNKQELGFLAGLQIPAERLRYTLFPHFGFVFLIQGKKSRHFVWELLNSHATYVWSAPLEQNHATQWEQVEALINQVREMGRDQYKQSYVRNPVESDWLFQVVAHENKNSDFVDAFPRWKHRLMSLLV
jgi:hypothetical protein